MPTFRGPRVIVVTIAVTGSACLLVPAAQTLAVPPEPGSPCVLAQGGVYATHPSFGDIVAVDIDGDLDIDLAKTSSLFDTVVSVLLNDGAGAFGGNFDYDFAGDVSLSLAAGDLDGDGDVDLAVASFRDLAGLLSVLLNEGKGVFATPVSYDTNSTLAYGIAVGDLDGDTDLDVVTVSTLDNTSVLMNNGDGTFGTAITYSVGGSNTVALGDLDGDSDLDVVLGGSVGVKVLLNDGAGTLGPVSLFGAHDTGAGPHAVVLGDMDGDLDLDVVKAVGGGSGPDGVAVLRNDGDATFDSGVLYSIGDAFSLALGDLDGDLDLDVAATRFYAGDIEVLLNDGNGVLGAPTVYLTNPAFSATVADLNGDDDADLAVTHQDGTVSVWLNDCPTPPCPADLDDSNHVGFFDLLLLFVGWGQCPPDCTADIDGSGDVGQSDLLLVLAGWGPCP